MSITRVGATKQYSDNWDSIFGGGRRRSTANTMATKPVQKSPKKSPKGSAKKAGAKKRVGLAKRKAR